MIGIKCTDFVNRSTIIQVSYPSNILGRLTMRFMVICCNSPVGCLCLVLIFRHLSTCWYIMPHLSFFPVHYKCPLILWYFLVAFGWTRWDVSCALDNDYFLNLLSFKNDHPYTKLHYKNISLSSSTFFFFSNQLRIL